MQYLCIIIVKRIKYISGKIMAAILCANKKMMFLLPGRKHKLKAEMDH